MTQYSKIINKRMKAVIDTVDDGYSLEGQPMFAINWLNLKSSWMYSLYTYLAFPMASSIGAVPIFKGNRLKVLADTAKVDREVLLIVRYPGPTEFLSLVGRKLFQIVSVLRIKSVVDFNLGFAHLLQGTKQPKDHNYLVYHWQNSASMKTAQQLEQLCHNTGVTMFFAAERVASLGIEQGDKTRKVPLKMDGLVIMAHAERDVLNQLVAAEDFQRLIQSQEDHYLGIFQRVL